MAKLVRAVPLCIICRQENAEFPFGQVYPPAWCEPCWMDLSQAELRDYHEARLRERGEKRKQPELRDYQKDAINGVLKKWRI